MNAGETGRAYGCLETAVGPRTLMLSILLQGILIFPVLSKPGWTFAGFTLERIYWWLTFWVLLDTFVIAFAWGFPLYRIMLYFFPDSGRLIEVWRSNNWPYLTILAILCSSLICCFCAFISGWLIYWAPGMVQAGMVLWMVFKRSHQVQ